MHTHTYIHTYVYTYTYTSIHTYVLCLRILPSLAANSCTCNGGTETVYSGSGGTLCDTNGQEDCSACDTGYTISETAQAGSAQTCVGECLFVSLSGGVLGVLICVCFRVALKTRYTFGLFCVLFRSHLFNLAVRVWHCF